MGKDFWNGKRKKAKKKENGYGGRAGGCDFAPAKVQCLRKMHGTHNGKCRHCRAPGIKAERVKIFGM